MGDIDEDLIPERKVEDFYFEQLKKLQIFKSPESLPFPKTYLLAVSNKFGFCFVGCPTGLRIIKTETIGKVNKEDERRINAIVTEYPSIYIDIGNPVRHVGISCDNLSLSVCYEQGDSIMLRLYDIPTICSPNGSQEILGDVVLSTGPGISLVNLLWNPSLPNLFATCFSNGSVALWEITENKINKTGILPVTARVTAICWSPKGKQIVVGHKDGHLTQYTPLLEVKKETPLPEIFKDEPHQVTSICWISAAVFLNVYTTEEEGDIPQCVLVCNATKTNPKQMINFDDVYFGMNEDREKGFYSLHLQEWNVTISASCNAFEIAVFGNEEKWEKWMFEGEKRAEIPLNSEKEETYPMGMAIDLTSTVPIVENEKSYPPAPLLLLLSTGGLLCPFYMINKSPKARHDIVKPAEPLPHPKPRQKIAAARPETKAPQNPEVQQQQKPFLRPVKAVSGPAQPAQPQPGIFTPSKNINNTFSFKPPVSSSQAFTNSTFNFSKPSFPSFNTAVPTMPSTAESKVLPLDGVGIPSSKPLFSSPGLLLKSSDAKVPSGSGSSSSGFSTASFSSSAGPSEKDTSQSPTVKPHFQTPLFPPYQPSSGPGPGLGLEKPSDGFLSKPTPVTQATGVPKEPDTSSYNSGRLILSNPRSQQMEEELQQQQLLQKQKERQQELREQQQLREQEMQEQQRLQQLQQQQEIEKQQELKQQQLEVQRLHQQRIEQQQAAEQQQQQQLKLQQQSAKQSTTQKNLDLSVSNCIFEEIQLFNKELDELRNDVIQIEEDCSQFSQTEKPNDLRRKTEVEVMMCDDLKQVTKSHNSEIQIEKKKLLGSFEVFEDARVRHHRAKDPRYLHLLKSRRLDPLNASKMRTIRELYMHLDKTLSEVNLTLDEEWNKENESQTKLQRPTMDAIYRTLQAHHMVAQEQSVKLEKMAEKLKQRKLLSSSWNKPPASSVDSREIVNGVPCLEGAIKSLALETTTRSHTRVPDNIPVNKSVQLINIMRKRQTTPIRRSMIVSPNASRTRQFLRKSEEPITTLSPPYCQESIVAETPLTRGTSGKNPLFFSTPSISNVDEATPVFENVPLGKNQQSCQNRHATSPFISKTGSYPQSIASQATRPSAKVPQKPESKLLFDKANLSERTGTPPISNSTTGTAPQKTEFKLQFDKADHSEMIGTPPISNATTSTAPPKTETKQPFDNKANSSQRIGTPPISNSTTDTAPQMTGSEQLFYKSPLLQRTPSGSATATATTIRPTGSQQMFPLGSQPWSTVAPQGMPTGTSSSSVGFSMPLSTEKNREGTSSSFTSMGAFHSTGAFSEKTTSFNQMPTNISPAALAAMSRAEKSSVEQSSLDASASIEPKSMVTHGQSSSERQRDIEGETIAAKTIAEEALKRSQLEAEKAGVKPQSSTEFSIKTNENSKPGPPVVTVKPVSSKNIPAPNVTVRPVAVPAIPFGRPSIIPSVNNPSSQSFSKPDNISFSVSSGSAGTAFGFSTGALKDTQASKDVVGLQTSTQKPISFQFLRSSNATIETDSTATSLLNESNNELKGSLATPAIVKPVASPLPSVSRKLFKDTSNQGTKANDQKEQPAVSQDLQTSSGSGTSSSGSFMGLDKENIQLGLQTGSSSNAEPKLGAVKESPFSFPTTVLPAFESVPAKEATPFDSSSAVKPFSSGSSSIGFFFGQPSTKASNVLGQFDSIQTASSSATTSISTGGSFSSAASFGLTTSKPLATTSLTSSSGVSSGVGSNGLTTGLQEIEAASLTAVSSSTSRGVVVTTVAFSQSSTAPLTQGTMVSTILTTQSGTTTPPPSPQTAISTMQEGAIQKGLFGVTTTAAREGASKGGLFGFTTKDPQGEPLKGSVFGVTTIASKEEPSKGGLFGVKTTAAQEGASTGGLFSVTTTAPQGEPAKGAVFGVTTIASKEEPVKGGLFGVTTTAAAQEGASTGGLFSVTKTAPQGEPAKGAVFGVTTIVSKEEPFKGGLFGVTTTAAQEGASTGGLFSLTKTGPQGEPTKGVFGVSTMASLGEPSKEGLFGVTTTTASHEHPTQEEPLKVFGVKTTASQEEQFKGGLFGATTTAAQEMPSHGGPFGVTTIGSQEPSQGSRFGVSQSGTTPGPFAAASIPSDFGQPSFGQPAFGQPTVTTVTSSVFSQSAFSKPQEATSTGIGLGFGGFGLGGQPSQLSNKNPFLASSSAIPSSGSLFGGNTSTASKPVFGSGSLSNSQPSGGFGGGSFSRGTGNVASSGFAIGGTGSPGFGGPPSFGSAPSFGSPSSFGTAAPSFGSAPVFGSSSQVTSPGGSFGSNTGSGVFGNQTFGAIACQSTASFGNVAKQVQAQSGFGAFAQQTTGFGGFGSPGSGTGASPGFGGSPTPSFNQWR